MEYREIGTTGVRVSAVALGTWAMGGNHWGPADDEQSVECIRRAVDMGITLIDTAPVYGAGHAEELVGKAIQGIRQRVVIATKCGLVIRDNNRKSLNPKDM